jgi:hypothetical protein
MINLSPQEQQMWQTIQSATNWSEKEPLVYELTLSIFKSGQMVVERWKWFSEKVHNIPRGGFASYLDDFRSNVPTPADVYKHPHFEKYLRYFICGPDLSKQSKSLIESIRYSDYYENRSAIRKHVRSLAISKSHEEFYKLAIELGWPQGHAENLRKLVMTTK